jgi:hypothetical protein
MTRALKYLEIELNTPTSDRHSLAKYRAASIHHRLASLLHNTFRTHVNRENDAKNKLRIFSFQDNPARRKRLRALASLHYQKALELFSPHDNTLEYLRLLIEEVALTDFELQSNYFASLNSKIHLFLVHRRNG